MLFVPVPALFLLQSEGLVFLFALAAALCWSNFLFGRKKRKEAGAAKPPAPVSADGGDPAGERQASGCQALSPKLIDLKRRLGLDDLEDFGLLGDLMEFQAQACRQLDLQTGIAVEDRTVRLAMDAAIARLEETEVPREIYGQRLAAVITKCTEAAEWEEFPECAAAAEACLEQRLNRRRPAGE